METGDDKRDRDRIHILRRFFPARVIADEKTHDTCGERCTEWKIFATFPYSIRAGRKIRFFFM
jgi:hypothetical protein